MRAVHHHDGEVVEFTLTIMPPKVGRPLRAGRLISLHPGLKPLGYSLRPLRGRQKTSKLQARHEVPGNKRKVEPVPEGRLMCALVPEIFFMNLEEPLINRPYGTRRVFFLFSRHFVPGYDRGAV